MKIYLNVLLVLLICGTTACKKKRTNPEPQPDESGKLQSITEVYDGETAKFLLSYNSQNQLQTYQKEGSTEKYSYTYEDNRVKTVTYAWDGKNYNMLLNYSPQGKMNGGTFTAVGGTGTVTELTLNCTQEGDLTLIKAYDGLFTLTVNKGNLVSAEFNAWYYKRKITFIYGNEPGILYGHNLYLPNEEVRNPLIPESNIMRIMVQMALQVFAKNNLTEVKSAMYERIINYRKDAHNKIVKSTTTINRMVDGEPQATSEKQVIYNY